MGRKIIAIEANQLLDILCVRYPGALKGLQVLSVQPNYMYNSLDIVVNDPALPEGEQGAMLRRQGLEELESWEAYVSRITKRNHGGENV